MSWGADAGSAASPGRNDRLFKLISLVAGVCLVAFIVVVAVRGTSVKRPPPATFPSAAPAVLPHGSVAPAFTLTRLGGGAPVALASTRGTPVIVNFFASWCDNCRAELAAVATVARSASGRVAVVGVDTSDTSSTSAEHLLLGAGATFPVGVDPAGALASRWRISVLPVTYFLNRRGQVEGEAFGAQTVASLDRWVSTLTGGAT
ncbi:MAG TPA: TlpA disulfide reductase family protein [Acidimicrobiales bacterium]|nr:TlpA disulfide reductase family protein [Acidimicrobiales bacterium]